MVWAEQRISWVDLQAGFGSFKSHEAKRFDPAASLDVAEGEWPSLIRMNLWTQRGAGADRKVHIPAGDACAVTTEGVLVSVGPPPVLSQQV